MEHRRPPLPVIILLLLVIVIGGGYFLYQNYFVKANGELKASGSIETTQVSIGPEVGGKVVEVLVDEGQTVKAGDSLFKLDDTLLQAQRSAALASLETAKAAAQSADAAVTSAQSQFNITMNAALVEDKNNRTLDWRQGVTERFDQPGWYFSQAEQLAAAQNEIDQALKALVATQQKLTDIEQKSTSAGFLQLEQAVSNARATFLIAKDLNDRVNAGVTIDDVTRTQLIRISRGQLTLNTLDQNLRDEAQRIYDDAISNLDDVQQDYDDALTTDAAKDILKARAQVSIAQERYYTSLDYLRDLQTGTHSSKVTAAQSTLDQAKTAAAQAQKAIEQAQAQIDLLDAQIAKLKVVAPSSGTVLTRNIEPGEFVQAGAAALVIGNLDELTITVYMPDSKYGQISLGSEALVSVDSFPGKTYQAKVTHIADQFEFTPRNVQTVEGRSNTVYAIRLTVTDEDKADLKPGMPADVVFVVGK